MIGLYNVLTNSFQFQLKQYIHSNIMWHLFTKLAILSEQYEYRNSYCFESLAVTMVIISQWLSLKFHSAPEQSCVHHDS